MKIHVLPPMMNYSAPTEKGTKGGKNKKVGKHINIIHKMQE